MTFGFAKVGEETPVGLPTLERYEMKYVVPVEWIGPISAFAEAYCALDWHSAQGEAGFYQVNSLYLDSPNFDFLKMRLGGASDRFNMRVRSYGERPRPPYFLEVKRKQGDIIRKYRARVTDPDLERMLDPAVDIAPFLAVPGDEGSAALFRRLVHAYGAVPVVMTGYRRKAYVSHCDEYARLTFDIGLRYRAESGYRPFAVEEGTAPTDVETLFDDGPGTILELKCYAKFVPLWMVDLVRSFGLRRRGFSKYSAGMAKAFGHYAYDAGDRRAKGWDV
jgi:SPX domain protein involved in polyphosphate accumulation